MAKREPSRTAASLQGSVRGGVPPSSARRRVRQPADEDDGDIFDPDEEIAQLGDGVDWPPQWGAARLGIP